MDIVAVQYPGRERRFDEPLNPNLSQWAELTAAELGEIGRDRPVGLFGHSMGGIVAYETALSLASSVSRNVQALIVAACKSPDQVSDVDDLLSADDDEFVSTLLELGGPAVWDIPEYRDLYLPVLRADLQALKNYQPSTKEILSTEIVALLGSEDTDVTVETVYSWEKFTTGAVCVEMMAGDHFFPHKNLESVTTKISKYLTQTRN